MYSICIHKYSDRAVAISYTFVSAQPRLISEISLNIQTFLQASEISQTSFPDLAFIYI